MALINDIELESGLVIGNAYHRIDSYKGTERYLAFIVNIYINEEAFDEGKPPITYKEYGLSYNKDRNLFSQMYEYLRSLPEYADAVEA